jgi:hypothetical protein
MKSPTGIFTVAFRIVPSAVTDGLVYLAMRNTSATKRCLLERIKLKGGFDGTTAATQSIFGVFKFAGANPGAGTANRLIATTPNSKFKVATAVTVLSVKDAGDITMTNTTPTVKAPFLTYAVENVYGTAGADAIVHPEPVTHYSASDRNDEQGKVLDLGEGDATTSEGLGIMSYGAVVAGCWLTGEITWREYTV